MYNQNFYVTNGGLSRLLIIRASEEQEQIQRKINNFVITFLL